MPWFQPMKVPAEGPQTRPSAIPRVAKKSFSVEEARGGRGGGGEEVERGRAHARATVGCRRHVSSRATRAT